MDHTSVVYLVLASLSGFLMAWGIGANDVSNAMGTSVGSKAVTIKQAILIAAVFEFLGAFLAGSEVTNTIRNDIVDPSFYNHDPELLVLGMLAALFSAGSWLLVASLFGWPVSTTHTIIGALIGFGLASMGFDSIQWHHVSYILLGWLLSPILGGIFSYLLFTTAQKLIFNQTYPIEQAKKVVPYYIFITAWIIGMITFNESHNYGLKLNFSQVILLSTGLSIIAMLTGRFFIQRLTLDPSADKKFYFTNVEKIFSVLMIFTACAMAFAHGSNDVANAIGPVAAIAGIAKGEIATESTKVPLWILLLGAGGIVAGLAMYGHKVIATVGNKITQLTPSRGFSATLAAAFTVVLASSTGLPISTTHTLVGAILGVGLARGIAALNLSVIRAIFMSWIVTLPAGALLCVAFYELLKLLLPHL